MINREISNKVLSIGIDYRLPRGGVAQVINAYAPLFEHFRFVSTVVALDRSKAAKLWAMFTGYFHFLWLMLFGGIKIVHVHASTGASFWRKRLFINTAKLFGKKVIYHMHGGRFKQFMAKHDRPTRKLLEKCDCVIALSPSWGAFFQSIPQVKRVEVVENIIPRPVIRRRVHAGVSILFLGKLCHEKGIYDLLDVIAENKGYFEGKIKLYIGGNGEVNRVRNFINDNDIDSIVDLQGWVDGIRKEELYNESDVVILPSYVEGVPLSILEAMSYSLPVIATPVGGVPELIQHGKNGWLFSPGDKDALRSLLMDVVTDRNTLPQMGQASQPIIANHYPDRVEERLRQIYVSLLND